MGMKGLLRRRGGKGIGGSNRRSGGGGAKPEQNLVYAERIMLG